MNKYKIVMSQYSYGYMHVEAVDEEEAEMVALEKYNNDCDCVEWDDGMSEVSSVEEE